MLLWPPCCGKQGGDQGQECSSVSYCRNTQEAELRFCHGDGDSMHLKSHHPESPLYTLQGWPASVSYCGTRNSPMGRRFHQRHRGEAEEKIPTAIPSDLSHQKHLFFHGSVCFPLGSLDLTPSLQSTRRLDSVYFPWEFLCGLPLRALQSSPYPPNLGLLHIFLLNGQSIHSL